MDFEQLLQAFYEKLDLAGTKVIDIGAHVGRHAIPLARRAGATGMVLAFEPLPQIRLRLVQALDADGLNNVAVLPFALSNRSGADTFVYTPECPEESGLRRRAEYNVAPTRFEHIPVTVCRLDDLVRGEGVGFIKIDVEGGELDVLSGATRCLEAGRPIVAFECGAASYRGYHGSPQAIYELFATRGYRIYSILGHEMADADSFAQASRDQNFWDYVALPEERASEAVKLG